MEEQAYIITAMIGRYILIIICFLVFIQALLEIWKANQKRRYSTSDKLATLKWLRKKAFYALDYENIVGRSNSCEVIVKSNTVKRKHFRIFLDCEEWFLEPLKNCEVFLNNELVEEKTLIYSGDQITLGREHLVFDIVSYTDKPEEIND